MIIIIIIKLWAAVFQMSWLAECATVFTVPIPLQLQLFYIFDIYFFLVAKNTQSIPMLSPGNAVLLKLASILLLRRTVIKHFEFDDSTEIQHVAKVS